MKKIKEKRFVPILLAVLLAVVLLDGVLFLNKYTWVAGGLRAKDAGWVDLSGKNLTVSEFEAIQKKMPDCTFLWDVPFQDTTFPSNSRDIHVSTLSEADFEALDSFTELHALTGDGCRDYAALVAYQEHRPDCYVSYNVIFGDREFRYTSAAITVENADYTELTEGIPYLPNLADVELIGTLPTRAELIQLQSDYPEIDFHWDVEFLGKTLKSTAETLDYSGKKLTYDQVDSLVNSLSRLQSIDLHGTGLTVEELKQLQNTYPDCVMIWDLETAGKTFSTDSEEIDVSGFLMDDTSMIEAVLPYFPRLNRVIMCGCGLDDETMDALNKKYDNVRFVWEVKIKDVFVRTDAKYFYPFKFYKHMRVEDEDLYPLRYCIDMEAIDIGHMTTVTNCDWVAFMPNMKYLIIVETAITDISPLANLKNLVFLEIFTTGITDYTPLLECTALEDLNLGRTYGDPAPIAKMTWLKNLWWSGIEGTIGLPCSDAPKTLPKALPHTTMKFNLMTPNVENGWRQLPNYYAMRDLMDVFYLA